MSDETRLVGAYMAPDLVAELDALKQHYGIHSTSELLRMLIRQESRRLSESTYYTTTNANNQAGEPQ